jgi:hypothetical protein
MVRNEDVVETGQSTVVYLTKVAIILPWIICRQSRPISQPDDPLSERFERVADNDEAVSNRMAVVLCSTEGKVSVRADTGPTTSDSRQGGSLPPAVSDRVATRGSAKSEGGTGLQDSETSSCSGEEEQSI